MRAVFCGQFALTVMAGEWILRRCREPRIGSLLTQAKTGPRLALILVIAGLFTTVAEATALRAYPLLQDADMVVYRLTDWSDLGLSVASIRRAYEWIQEHSDPEVVVQFSPSDTALYLVGAYADRQTAVTGSYQLEYRAKYRPAIASALAEIGGIFSDTSASRSAVGCTCARWGIRYLVVTSHDPVWNAPESWIRHSSPVYQNERTGVYECSALQSR
jgi:hypothetical protein